MCLKLAAILGLSHIELNRAQLASTRYNTVNKCFEALRHAMLRKNVILLDEAIRDADRLGLSQMAELKKLPNPYILHQAQVMYTKLTELLQRLQTAMQECNEDLLLAAISGCDTVGFLPEELEQAKALLSQIRKATEALRTEMGRGGAVATWNLASTDYALLEKALEFAAPIIGGTTKGLFLVQEAKLVHDWRYALKKFDFPSVKQCLLKAEKVFDGLERLPNAHLEAKDALQKLHHREACEQVMLQLSAAMLAKDAELLQQRVKTAQELNLQLGGERVGLYDGPKLLLDAIDLLKKIEAIDRSVIKACELQDAQLLASALDDARKLDYRHPKLDD
jgi:hypothetical protein